MLKDKNFEGGIANVGLGDLSRVAAKFTSLYWAGEIGHPERMVSLLKRGGWGGRDKWGAGKAIHTTSLLCIVLR